MCAQQVQRDCVRVSERESDGPQVISRISLEEEEDEERRTKRRRKSAECERNFSFE